MVDQKPVMSLFPFEGIINEIVKFQGDRPALLVLYAGPNDITFLKHNMSLDDEIADLFMKHLSIEVLKERGLLRIVKK